MTAHVNTTVRAFIIIIIIIMGLAFYAVTVKLIITAVSVEW